MSGTVEIPLTNTDEVAVIDREDYDLVVSHGDWHMSDSGYAIRRYKGVTYRMHRVVMKPSYRLFVDHINHNKLDNRKSNLRIVSQAENNQNQKARKHRKHDLPSGITFDESRGQFYATRKFRKRFNNLTEAIKWTDSSKDEVLGT